MQNGIIDPNGPVTDNEVEIIKNMDAMDDKGPKIRDGYKKYLQKLDEIEQKVKIGYYDHQVKVDKKKKKYVKLAKAYKNKADNETNPQKKQEYLDKYERVKKRMNTLR